MRIVCWAQHLTGVGHIARMRAIAHGLAAAHEVFVVDGGAAVPLTDEPPRFHGIALQRISRGENGLQAEGTADIAGVLKERAARLGAAVAEIAPDVVLIEHFPFSKWELEREVSAAIDAARASNAQVRIIASLRDIAPQTRYEEASRSAYRARVVATLNDRFDGLLVHGDSKFTRLEESFDGAGEIAVPIAYSGLVVPGNSLRLQAPRGDDIALSCGGGDSDLAFIETGIKAFQALRAADASRRALRLRVFAGLFFSDRAKDTLRAMAGREDRVQVNGFSPDFDAVLRTAALSISRAGYNTCALILSTGTRAVLVPNRRMSDQAARAQLMHANGWGVCVSGDPPPTESLVAGMRQALDGPPPAPDIELHGVARTRALVEQGFGSRRR